MNSKPVEFDHHPDRDEMLAAIRTGELPFREHLANCSWCRGIYDFLSLGRCVERLESTAASSDAIHRHCSLPLSTSGWLPRRTEVGRPLYDSWTNLPVTITRDSAMGLERNLRFVSGAITLELVADHTPGGWHFAARCYRDGAPSAEFVLKIGRKRLSPGLHRCYSWTSLKAPRTIQLLSPSVRLVFDTGTW